MVDFSKPSKQHRRRNGHQQDGLFVDLKREQEEGQRRVDERQHEAGFGRPQEEQNVGGERGKCGGSQTGHGQRLDVVKVLDLDNHVDGAPGICDLEKKSVGRNSLRAKDLISVPALIKNMTMRFGLKFDAIKQL